MQERIKRKLKGVGIMEIQITDYKIKNHWDYQRAKLVLEMAGISSEGIKNLSTARRNIYEKKITLFLWEKIKEQFPEVEQFCTSKTGNLNKCDKDNHNTPIINIHGSFYMQLVSENNNRAWCWESIDLEPFRFYFNEEGYFKNLVIAGMNKAIIGGYDKERFKPLVEALNRTKTKEQMITIQSRGKDIGKVGMLEYEPEYK